MKKTVIVLLFLLLQHGYAQEQSEEIAVLKRGPLSRRGIPVLQANIIPHFYGEYEYRGFTLYVYYTTEKIVPLSEWEKSECNSYELWGYYFSHIEEREVFFYTSDRGWNVFLSFPPDFKDYCVFTQKFLDRLRYFISITRDQSQPPFPDIL